MSEVTDQPKQEASHFQRDEKTGLEVGRHYHRDANGRIEWKRHIPAKYIKVRDDKKAEVVKKYAKEISELDLATIEEYYLYISLGGYNEVARIRGYSSLIQKVDYVSDSKAVCTCTIDFIPNCEDEMGLTVSGVASAVRQNVGNGFETFLETIAENRAMSRAVRRALNINIVAQEELAPKNSESGAKSGDDAVVGSESVIIFANDSLVKKCKEMKVSFETVKTGASKYVAELGSNPTTWTDFKSIPELDSYFLFGKLLESEKKK